MPGRGAKVGFRAPVLGGCRQGALSNSRKCRASRMMRVVGSSTRLQEHSTDCRRHIHIWAPPASPHSRTPRADRHRCGLVMGSACPLSHSIDRRADRIDAGGLSTGGQDAPPPSRRQQSRMLRRVSDQVTRGEDRRGLEVKILTLKGIRDCGRRWVKEERTGEWTLPEQKSMPGAVQVVGGAPLWVPCFARLFILYL